MSYRGITGYQLYMKEWIKENKSHGKEGLHECAKSWHSLSWQTRNVWCNKAQEYNKNKDVIINKNHTFIVNGYKQNKKLLGNAYKYINNINVYHTVDYYYKELLLVSVIKRTFLILFIIYILYNICNLVDFF
jgi:hypothetical protein